jgi:hypothetical protein
MNAFLGGLAEGRSAPAGKKAFEEEVAAATAAAFFGTFVLRLFGAGVPVEAVVFDTTDSVSDPEGGGEAIPPVVVALTCASSMAARF